MEYVERLKLIIEEGLKNKFSYEFKMPYQTLIDAMKYSLEAGGKRIRPIMTLLFSKAAGGDINDTLPVALSLELLHTYTLIHDDLPAMDNDVLRRGKPTNHVVFGECTAILAGDALQAAAFKTVLRCDLPVEVRAECATILAVAASCEGVCGGQQIDMEGETNPLSEEALMDMQGRKTGSLLMAACEMGAVAGGANEKQREAARLYGMYLGQAFQIRDDMLDEITTEEKLGKSLGKDKKVGKTTCMTLYGLEKCKKMVEALTNSAKEVVKDAFGDCEHLLKIADFLVVRDY